MIGRCLIIHCCFVSILLAGCHRAADAPDRNNSTVASQNSTAKQAGVDQSPARQSKRQRARDVPQATNVSAQVAELRFNAELRAPVVERWTW